MKKILVIVFVLVVVGGVVAILFSNKAKNEAKTKAGSLLNSYSVTTMPTEKKLLEENLILTGTINANREVMVVSETNGKIVEVNASVGDNVTAGKSLVKVDDEVRRATLANAEAVFEKAKKDLDRYEQLNKEKSVNDAQLEATRLAFKSAEAQLIIAKRQLNDTKIVAPISGVVTSRNVEVGTVLAPGTPVANIIEISTLKIKVNVPENDVLKLKAGEKVEITNELYPDLKFYGTIKNINSKADEAHTYPVEIQMTNNSKTPLKAGMFAKIRFLSIKNRECLTIPREALVGSVRDPQVFVVENGIAKLRQIEIGIEYNNMLEIRKGLNAGEKVVTSGQINLRDNVQVTEVNTTNN